MYEPGGALARLFFLSVFLSARHAAALAHLRSIRFGEAANPGPVNSACPVASDSHFILGSFNPTGLNGKHGIVSELPRGLYAVAESHLTARGVELFRSGLHFAGAPFRYLAGPPSPARARSCVTGDYTGVGFLSSFVGRGAPHDIEPALFASARVCIASFLVGTVWVLGAVIYGLPVAPRATEVLLEAVTRRVILQGTGPRFIAGDFNLQPQALSHAQVWAEHGFFDVQDLWHQRTGVLPQVTCKNATRKDYVFVSAELQPLLREVTVDPAWFPDHSLLMATFDVQGLSQPRPIWRLPRHRPLPAHVVRAVAQAPCSSLPEDPSDAYRAIWASYEQVVSDALSAQGLPSLRKAELGRASTRDVFVTSVFQGVVPKGRDGEVGPTFFGPDRQYVQWFRQLRRLQALCQALHRSAQTDAACEYRAGLWHAVLKAPGFRPSFQRWWSSREVVQEGDPEVVGSAIPSSSEAQALFDAFQANVRCLERRLKTRRQKAARQRRVSNPALVFKDIRGPQARQVETIVEARRSKVAQVLADESAVVLVDPVQWQSDEGFFLDGAPVEVYHAEPDKMWGNFAQAVEGAEVSQQRVIADLPGLFKAVGEEWSRRWMRHESINMDHWQAVLESLPRHDQEAGCLQPLTVSTWKAAVKAKHAHSATGMDGVSRADLLALPNAHTLSLLAMCRQAERDGSWPQQVLDARVSALEKLPDAATVMQYRPICVLSIVYRTWSSIRAKEALQYLVNIAPPTLYGNLPGRSAGCVWYQMQLAVEQAHVDSTPLVGALLDLSKAFNTLPRPPVFALAIRLGLPRALVVAWSGAVAKLARRFRVRGATGPPLASFTGFPEGCALSCVAMLLVDFALHRFVDGVSRPGVLQTYVDDWQLLEQGVPQLQRALSAVNEFFRGWDLTMDPTKTIHWATAAVDRRALRRSGVAVAPSARNLGGCMTFTKARVTSMIADRVQTLQDLWPRLAASPAPLGQKLRAVVAAAWPKALHGISAVTL